MVTNRERFLHGEWWRRAPMNGYPIGVNIFYAVPSAKNWQIGFVREVGGCSFTDLIYTVIDENCVQIELRDPTYDGEITDPFPEWGKLLNWARFRFDADMVFESNQPTGEGEYRIKQLRTALATPGVPPKQPTDTTTGGTL